MLGKGESAQNVFRRLLSTPLLRRHVDACGQRRFLSGFAVIAREGWNIKRSDFLRDCIYTFYGMQGAAVGLRVLSRSDVVWRPSKRLGGGFPVAGANLPHN